MSGVVTCFNSERHIGACIESLIWCDEIVVLDSFSTDRTPEIVRRYDKARLIQREYFGAAAAKNYAIERAVGDWILILDSDECCTPELRDEIQELLQAGPNQNGYTIRRRVYFLGRQLRFSGWRRDRVTRLIRRGRGYYERRRVHARMVTSGPAPELRSKMDHMMVDDLREFTQRLAKYAYWGAAQAWREGRRSNWIEIVFRPLWRFARMYVLQLGVLDGAHGLVFCMLQAYATYLKWAQLWGWQINAARGIAPDLPDFDDSEATWNGLQRIRSEGTARAGS